MKNFESLFAAYLLAWAIFFGFLVTVSVRMSRVRKDLERLRDRLTGQ